jgi:hypothetical protein
MKAQQPTSASLQPSLIPEEEAYLARLLKVLKGSRTIPLTNPIRYTREEKEVYRRLGWRV